MGKTKRKDSQKEIMAVAKKEDRKAKQQWKKERQREKNYHSAEELQFASMLEGLGLRIKHVDGDGNCLFRSIADQLTGVQDNCGEYRKLIVDYIEQHSEHFSLFMEDDEPFDNYVERMRDHGEWGGHQELFAASQCFRVNIYVHQVDAPRFIINSDLPSRRDIHISFHGECHYNSVRNVEDTAIDQPATIINLDSSNGNSHSAHQKLEKSSSSSSSSSCRAAELVKQALPWIDELEILNSLELTNYDVDNCIELLMTDNKLLSDASIDIPNIEALSLLEANVDTALPPTVETNCEAVTTVKSTQKTKSKGKYTESVSAQSSDVANTKSSSTASSKPLSKKDKRLLKKASKSPPVSVVAAGEESFSAVKHTGAGGILEIVL